MLRGDCSAVLSWVEMRTGVYLVRVPRHRSWMTKSINLLGRKSVPKSIQITRSIS